MKETTKRPTSIALATVILLSCMAFMRDECRTRYVLTSGHPAQVSLIYWTWIMTRSQNTGVSYPIRQTACATKFT